MSNLTKYHRIYFFGTVLLIACLLSGCGFISSAVENVTTIVGLNETGTVIAKRAQIRSSYAVVAADLLEVKRGDKLQILEETDFEKVKWFRVRANDEVETEGWIEAQNVILGENLEKSKSLAEAGKDLQPQATGQLRAASNLRLSPEQSDDNILLKLDNGSTFEIISWQFVPKIQTVSDVDDGTNSAAKPKNPEIEAAKDKNEPEKLFEKYDVWYQVRLDSSVSPAPAGWLFGRQVELQVPSDIVFYQQNDRKFVTWQRIDDVADSKFSAKPGELPISQPGSWVILWRNDDVKAINGQEPDFDGILVLGYDKYNQEHYTIYRNKEVWGRLPLRMEGPDDNKVFSLKLMNNATGQTDDKRFVITKSGNRLKVTPPPDIANYEKKTGK